MMKAKMKAARPRPNARHQHDFRDRPTVSIAVTCIAHAPMARCRRGRTADSRRRAVQVPTMGMSGRWHQDFRDRAVLGAANTPMTMCEDSG